MFRTVTSRISSRSCSRIINSSIRIPSQVSPLLVTLSGKRFYGAFEEQQQRHELIKVIETELEAELDSTEKNTMTIADFDKGNLTAAMKSFLKTTGFKVNHTPGNDFVSLTKETEDFKVEVSWQVSQIYQQEAPPNPDENELLDDPERDEEAELDFFFLSFDVNILKKEGDEKMTISLDMEKHNMTINSVHFNEKFETPYLGPDIASLDDTLTFRIEKFLDSFDVNDRLFEFAWEYTSSKEVSEYVRWLDKFKKFLIRPEEDHR